MKPTTPKPPAPSAVAPGAAVPGAKPPVSTKLAPGAVRHDAQGKGILMWAAVTARHLALTTSQVLRRLDHSELSLDETAPRGKPSLRPTQLPGGGANPYENAPRSGRGAKNSTVIKGAGAAQAPAQAPGVSAARGGRATTRPRSSVPERSSWWQRLFRRA